MELSPALALVTVAAFAPSTVAFIAPGVAPARRWMLVAIGALGLALVATGAPLRAEPLPRVLCAIFVFNSTIATSMLFVGKGVQARSLRPVAVCLLGSTGAVMGALAWVATRAS